MKNMKKRMTAGFLMALMLVVSVFGNVTTADAATLSAKQYLVKMEKVMSKVKSVEMSQSTTVGMSMNGEKISSKVSGSIVLFNDSMKAKCVQKATVTMAGQKQTSTVRMYVKQSKGKLYVYTSTDGAAYEKTELGDMSEFTAAAGQVDVDTNTISNAKIVDKSAKVGKSDTVKISCSITGKDMAQAVKQTGMDTSSLDQMGIDFSTMKPIKVTYWIDKKTYRPLKCSVDMTAFMNDICNTVLKAMVVADPEAASGASIEMKCTSAKSTVAYKNFNKAKKFSYPKACK